MIDNPPLVSIVTPSYNQGQYLEETILSVLKQDYPNIEYIIIDGGSTDQSIDIIKKHQDKIAWWISEPDKGQADALAKGLSKANGKYLAWLCSDDILEPSMASLSVHFLEKNQDAILTYGNRTRIDAKGNILGISKPFFPAFLFKFGIGLPQETVMFRHDAYKQVGGINTDLQMVMDYDLWCKFFRLGSFFYIPAFLGRFRSHHLNKSTMFSQQLNTLKASGEYTSEFFKIYKLYFGKNLNIKFRRLALKISLIYRHFSLRTKKYYKIKREIVRIRENEK